MNNFKGDPLHLKKKKNLPKCSRNQGDFNENNSVIGFCVIGLNQGEKEEKRRGKVMRRKEEKEKSFFVLEDSRAEQKGTKTIEGTAAMLIPPISWFQRFDWLRASRITVFIRQV